MTLENIHLGKFIEIYFSTGLTLILILIFYEFVMYTFQQKVNLSFFALKKKLIYHPKHLIGVIKADNLINKFFRFIRLNWIKYSSTNREREKFYDVLNGGVIKNLLQLTGYLVFSKIGLLTFVITCLIYFRSSFNFNEITNIDLQSTTNWSLKNGQLGISLFKELLHGINNLILFIPSFIVIVAIIVAIFLVNIKSRYYDAIKQANREYLVELVKIHRELSRLISILIYKGSNNLSRALEVYHQKPYRSIKDLIVKYRMLKLSPYIIEIENNEVIWKGEKRNYFRYHKNEFPVGFDEISEINSLVDIIEKAKIEGKEFDLLSISKLNKNAGELFKLYYCDCESLNRLMFTESGLKKMVEEANRNFLNYEELQNGKPIENIQYYNNKILDEQNNFKNTIDRNIIEGMELLISLMKYVEAVDKNISFRKRKINDIISQFFELIFKRSV